MAERDDLDPPQSGDGGPPIKLVLLLVLVIAIAVFFFQNTHEAPIEFLWLDGTWPMWAVIGVSVAAGLTIGYFGGWLWRRSRRRRGES